MADGRPVSTAWTAGVSQVSLMLRPQWALLIQLFLLLLWPLVLAPAKAAEPSVVVVLGDSIAAGYGVAAADSFPAKLQDYLDERGIEAEVRNAGVSGDTSSGALSRLDWAVGPDTDAVILEIGGNDALRGIDPAESEKNIDRILKTFAERDLPVLLAGMKAPPNMGPEYVESFDAIFPRLAEVHDVVFYPFILDGVAADPRLNQPDMIHPNADGVDLIVEQIGPYVVQLLNRI